MLATLTRRWPLASESSDENFVELRRRRRGCGWRSSPSSSALLVADLLLVHRDGARHHAPRKRPSRPPSGSASAWPSPSSCAGRWGGQAAGEYISGYLIEKSLSVDNVFVWAVIIELLRRARGSTSSGCCSGASSARSCSACVFIFAGVALLEPVRVDAVRVRRLPALHGRPARCATTTRRSTPRTTRCCKLVRRVVPSTTEYDGQKLFTRRTASGWPRRCSPCWSLIETTDVVFAVDSIPAILAVSREHVHRLQLERLRHPRPAGAVLPARRPARQVRLPADRPGRHPRLRRHQDDRRRVVPHPHVRSRWASSPSCSPCRSCCRCASRSATSCGRPRPHPAHE